MKTKWECILDNIQKKQHVVQVYGETWNLIILGIITVNQSFGSFDKYTAASNTLKMFSSLIALFLAIFAFVSLLVYRESDHGIENRNIIAE